LTQEIEGKLNALQRRPRDLHPEVAPLFVKPQNSIGFEIAVFRRFGI
jgi:hypothetical protein